MTDTENLTVRRGGKSAAAFRTISEVASDLDVPQHVLRFWETKLTQVRPMKRGGGRRYYRPEDVDLLRSIRALLYVDGYTIKGVQKLLREGGLKQVVVNESLTPATPVSAALQAASQAPAAAGVSVGQRNELKAILGELEAARKLLDSAR